MQSGKLLTCQHLAPAGWLQQASVLKKLQGQTPGTAAGLRQKLQAQISHQARFPSLGQNLASYLRRCR